jgi:hypothetical protein
VVVNVEIMTKEDEGSEGVKVVKMVKMVKVYVERKGKGGEE